MDRPTRYFYAVAFWLSLESMLWLLATPVGFGVLAAVALALLWPFFRWPARGWWRVPAAFVLGWLAGLWSKGWLGTIFDRTPTWVDDFVLLPASLLVVVWLLLTVGRRNSEVRP